MPRHVQNETPPAVGQINIWDGTKWIASSDYTRFDQGPTEDRPPAGIEGRQYLDTDSGITYWDTGTEWVSVGGEWTGGGNIDGGDPDSLFLFEMDGGTP